MNLEYFLSELNRRVSNIIRIGVISEVDTETAKVKVNTAGITTDWLPWLTSRAGADIAWWAPTVGEQVLLLSPFGELAFGVVFPALYSDAFPQNSNSEFITKVSFLDGTIVEYDRENSTLTVNCVGDVLIESAHNVTITAEAVTINGPLTVNGATEIAGNLEVTGDIQAGGEVSASSVTAPSVEASGISLSTHVHSGVESGGSTTSPPE
jgi:phage baseplate assembly protein V